MARCGCRRRPGPSGPRRPRSGTGCRGRPSRVRRAARRHRASAGCMPLGAAGLGQRPPVDQQRVQRRPDAADVVLGRGVGHGRGERERHVAVDADPDPAGVVDRQRDAGPVCGLGRRGQRLDGPGAADRRRRGVGHLLQRAAADPLGHHQAAGPGARDVEHPCDAGHVDPAQPRRARQDLLHLPSGRVPSGSTNVSATCRSRAVSSACQNCRCGRAAVEHQQPVAAAGDAGAGDQVDVFGA